MHRFKSAILAKLKNCQNGTFKPVHEIQKFFWPKAFFWSVMKMGIRKNIHNLSKGPPNLGLMQEKVQNGDFLKKDSVELKNFVCFRFLWISRRPGNLNWERLFFWLTKNLYKQCASISIMFFRCTFARQYEQNSPRSITWLYRRMLFDEISICVYKLRWQRNMEFYLWRAWSW